MKFKYENNFHCRWCGISDETLQHVVNCGSDDPVINDVQNIIVCGTDTRKMKEIAERIELFLDRVEV